MASSRTQTGRGRAATSTTGRERQAFRSWLILAFRQGLISLVTVGGVFGLALLLEPADFAVYGYASSLMLIAAAVGDLGLGARVIKSGAGDRSMASSFGLQLSVWLPACALAALVVIVAGAYGLSSATGALLIGTFFFVSLQTLPTAVLERQVAFPAIAKIEVGQRTLFVGGALALAALTRSAWSVAASAAAAALAGYLAAAAASRWRWRPAFTGFRDVFYGFSSNWWQARLASQLNYAVYPLLGGLLFTKEQVGLIVWALAVTSVPTLFSPLASRAMFPSVADVPLSDQIAVFRRLLRALLLVSLPLVAATFVCAEPLTLFFFGNEWRDGIVLLRLESVTTLLGVALTPAWSLFFLALEPKRVKRVVVAWALAMWTVTPIVAIWASYLAPSLVQIGVAALGLVALDRMLASASGYSLVRDLKVGVFAVLLAVAVGQLGTSFATDRLTTAALFLVVAAIQVGVTLALRGGVDPRALLAASGRSDPSRVRASRDSR